MVFSKFKEVSYSVFPIVILVVVLHFTLVPISTSQIIRFIIGSALIIFGMTIFLIGVDLSISPIGNIMGSTIIKTNKIFIVALAGLILGFIISIAEPDLHILARQIDSVTSGLVSKNSIVVIVSVGIALMLSIGLSRIVHNFSLNKTLLILYGIIAILAVFASPEFLAISFDASGATTGALTVPFILALAFGVSKLKKDSRSSQEDSFGLVGITSTGAIISVLIMSILSNTDKITGTGNTEIIISSSIIGPFLDKLPSMAAEVALALSPIIILFIVFQFISFKLTRSNVRRILFGLLFAFIGLVVFLLGVNSGFMEVGNIIGFKLASMSNKAYIIAVGFILGLVTILAEPAVYVLTHQIEDITSGYVKRKAVMITLALGVAIAVSLSVLKILIPQIKLWHYLLPGYVLSVVMSFFVPKLFVGIAFDSGGVASGPMTASFILSYAQGAAQSIKSANVLLDGFGVIAMVAMTPLIALQLLGFIFKMKSKKKGI